MKPMNPVLDVEHGVPIKAWTRGIDFHPADRIAGERWRPMMVIMVVMVRMGMNVRCGHDESPCYRQ